MGVLFTKMGRGQLEQETLGKVGQLVDSLQVSGIGGAHRFVGDEWQRGWMDAAVVECNTIQSTCAFVA